MLARVIIQGCTLNRVMNHPFNHPQAIPTTMAARQPIGMGQPALMEKARCDGTQTHDRANRQIDTSRENDQGHGKGMSAVSQICVESSRWTSHWRKEWSSLPMMNQNAMLSNERKLFQELQAMIFFPWFFSRTRPWFQKDRT